MLKIKMNIKRNELLKTDFVRLNELQENNNMLVFPFYDRAVIQFVELKEENEFYLLEFCDGKNENEVIVNKGELRLKWWIEAIETFLEFNNKNILEYDHKSLCYLVDFLIDNYIYKIHSVEDGTNGKILRIDLTSTLSIIYDLNIDSYGSITGEGHIIDRELDTIISGKLYLRFDKCFGEITESYLEDVFDSIESDYLYKTVKNSLV